MEIVVYATHYLRTPRGLVTRGHAGVVEGKIIRFGKILYDVKWTNGVHETTPGRMKSKQQGHKSRSRIVIEAEKALR
jgi:hypothetical protein